MAKDLFNMLTEFCIKQIESATKVDEDGKDISVPIDPRTLAEIRKHAADIKSMGMNAPGSAQSSLVNNMKKAIDEGRIKLADEEAA